MIVDQEGDLPEQGLMDQATIQFVRKLLTDLPPREQKILELRFSLDGYEGPPRTFKQIGKVIGLTRERVRQLEKKALAELKEIVDELL